MNDNDPILRDLETVLTYGGREVTWQVPATATVAVTDDITTHMLDGAVITFWTED